MVKEEKISEKQEFGRAKIRYLKRIHDIQETHGENNRRWPKKLQEERKERLSALKKAQEDLGVPEPLFTIIDVVKAIFPGAVEIDPENEEETR